MNLKEIKEKTEYLIIRATKDHNYNTIEVLHLYSILDLVNSLQDKMNLYEKIYEDKK